MALTARREPPSHHPWLGEFVRAPVDAFGDLLAGYAKVPPYDRADAPDAARMLFGPLPPDDPARRELGPAILGWLSRRRKEPAPGTRPRLQSWVREICEAFEIVSFLDVADAAAELRRHFIVWNEWTAQFVLSPARDAHAEYWRMLALTQPLLGRGGMRPDPAGLAPLWLDVYRQAGGTLPPRYLGIGLLGLRRLPASPSGSDAAWVTGLAQWALARQPTDAEFQAEWLALKPLYPRTDERWRELVGRLLATQPFRDAGITPPAWWRADPDFRAMVRPDYRLHGAPLRSPLPEDCTAEINRLGEPWMRVEPRIDLLMQRHRQFLNATGEPRYFVRAIHALSSALIQSGGDELNARARKAQTLAREGIDWEPHNRFLWSLWRDALVADGALEAAELVGWEAVRRDPNDVDKRNQLATLLAEALGRPADAEAVLRDIIAAFPFPQNAYARAQLAELLIAEDRVTEAETVVDAAFAAQAVAEATYALRARLLSHRGQTQAAAATLHEGRGRFPSNAVLEDYERVLAGGRSLFLKNPTQLNPPKAATSLPRTEPADDPALADTVRYGRLRRLRSTADGADATARHAALAEVQAILRDEPTFAYAQLLAARHGFWQAVTDTLPSFAAAFELALADGDRARLEVLAKQQPRLEALTLVARAVLGDSDAAWLVEKLLQTQPSGDEARPVAILRAGLRPILAAANDVPIPEAIAANRDAILRHLHDAIEASLGDRLAA